MSKKFFPTLLALGLVVSCAKKRDYDEVFKQPELQSKSDFKTHRMVKDKNGNMVKEPIKYMYVPMTMGTPREVKVAMPFYQGDEKVVRLEWGEKGLQVIEFERDERFNSNPMNDVPVMVIPGKYLSYRCVEDEFGDCKNKEEENKELTWDQKDYFKPDYAELEVKEVNGLDLWGMRNLNGCYKDVSTDIVNYEISDGVINIELEKTFQVQSQWHCIINNLIEDKFSFNSFRVRYHYSLVELDKLASPDYEPIAYPTADHGVFGYFKTKKETLSDDLDPRRKKKEYFLNRFNPNQPNGELVYYLSKTFNKPENALFKRATYDGVKLVNKGLKDANVPFKMVLKEQGPNDNISPGDLRYNQIVLIDDPLANGLLGYGPSVKNPYTGEIVKAHTNMYGGVLTAIARRTYEAAVDITEEDILGKEKETLSDIKVLPSAYKQLPQNLVTAMLPEELVGTEDSPNQVGSEQVSQMLNISQAAPIRENLVEATDFDLSSVSVEMIQEKTLERLKNKIDLKKEYAHAMGDDHSDLNAMDKFILDQKKKEGMVHSEHRHMPEFFPIAGRIKVIYPAIKELTDITNANGTLKRWEKLTESQRKKVVDIILYHSYVSTFIHEIGHNLGLRHNFIGSFDKDNFYSEDEMKKINQDLSAVGLKAHGAPTYTSMMDYSWSNFNQLEVMGKYDIAALRFGYAREVELSGAKDEFMKIKNPLYDLTRQVELSQRALNEESKDILLEARETTKLIPAEKAKLPKEERKLEMLSEDLQILNRELEVIITADPNPFSDEAIAKNEEIDKKFKEYGGQKSLISALKEKIAQMENLVATAPDRSEAKTEEAKALDGKKLKNYLFCTDENAGLSSLCNRFDEGTDYVEIAKYHALRYKQSYRYTNFRDGKSEFNTYGLVNYAIRRYSFLRKARDIVEDYEFLFQFIPAQIMYSGCSPEQAQNPQNANICKIIQERIDSVKIISDMLVDIIQTPDHTCAIAKASAPKTIVEFRPLAKIYDNIKSEIDHVPTSCFDAAVKKTLFREGEGLVVAGENGKFFNGFKDTDPNFVYAQDRAVRGVWVDKLMAMHSLYVRNANRGTTDDNHMALIDIPFVQERLNNVLTHLVAGTRLSNPLPFRTASGDQFKIPYVIGSNYKIDQIERYFGWLKDFFGFPAHGEGDLVESLLYMPMQASSKPWSSINPLRSNSNNANGWRVTDFGGEVEEKAKAALRTITVGKTDAMPANWRVEDRVYFDDTEGYTYEARPQNTLAFSMISAINQISLLDSVDKKIIQKVLKRRTAPEAPESMTEAEKATFAAPLSVLQQLLDMPNPAIPEAAFASFFGPVNGPLVYSVYSDKEAATVITLIKETKEKLMNEPDADASEAEKKLYKTPVELLNAYITGALSKETTDFYKSSLEKLPVWSK